MGFPTKIATCCHCGSTTALRLETGRHELSCGSCGAPLRDLKMLPKKAARPVKKAKAVSHAPEPRRFADPQRLQSAKKPKPRKVKKRKGWFKDVAEDLFDLVEDIFD